MASRPSGGPRRTPSPAAPRFPIRAVRLKPRDGAHARRPGPRLTGRRGTISTEQQWQK